MSRETQYIGLTEAAQDFVAQCDPLPSDTSTTGMFDEEVPLMKWNMHPVFLAELKDYRRVMCIREVVQEVPWSSGPMIFTCLELDWGNGSTALAFEWVHDPTVQCEVDYERGSMWI